MENPKALQQRALTTLSQLDLGLCIFPYNIRQLYDYALTWTREVKYFWKRPFTLSTSLYILCRYGMVANILDTLALAQKFPTTSRDAGYRICAILSVLGRVGIAIVLGLRSYALVNGSKIILVIFGSLGFTVVAVAAIYITCISVADIPFPYCDE